MTLTLEEIKDYIFSTVAEKHSENFPLRVTLANANEQARGDIQELRDKSLLIWDFNMKLVPYMTPVSNPEGMISCVVYYGDAENGWVCMGYALGCVNKEGTAVEITHVEKRCDAGADFKSKFLPIIVDAFSAYGLYLNHVQLAKVEKFAFVGPLPGVIEYYKQHGFEYVDDYLGTDAVIKFLS
ncbi:hypothetical protein P3697_08805 [Vibrio parahaemolyticus]|nr:hypothetical protein [Vibrio parahaemolyticus]MDF5072670.1 hypothetical protein [Vibrio parahaemolyticus]MDF5302115.1 hypothetical protein [Vibrio parahaemolyticus]